ncbi:MAG: PAS domain-containing sensor histidine kinase, partial [Deltaproteobacteria bacterium]|nr:PAS domain-containing sensor histidine kinase [Deltaproteobacteria bacterium]
DNIPEVFWLHQIDPPQVLFVSAASTRIFGLPPQAVQSDFKGFMARIHPDDRKRISTSFQRPSASTASEDTFVFFHADGTRRTLHTKIFPIRDDAGQCTLLAGITEDWTKRLEVQKQEHVQQERMIQADKMISLGILAAGVAHEINNPNHLIRLNAQAVRQIWELAHEHRHMHDGPDNDPELARVLGEVPGLLQGMLKASDRIRDIVRHMKDFARPDDIATEQAVDMGAVLHDALELTANTLKNTTNRLKVDVDKDLPTVRGNHQRLEQVVINLLMNAAEALPGKDRGIFIRLGRRDAKRVELTVRDEGQGMSPDALHHVFDPFFTTKRDQGGLGLGLAISRTIVAAHGGELGFEAAPHGGTVARVTLPAMERPS